MIHHSTQRNNTIKLSIIIPVYNGGKTIEHLCKTLINSFQSKFKLEIVLVNDGSKDNSDQVCRALYLKYSTIITYIMLAKNFGEHNTLMAGFNHVTGDYCVTMDDDFQNPPEEVIKIVDEIQKGYDVVYTFYSSKKDSFFRNLGSALNDKVANVMLKKPAHLYLSSFKIVNRFIINEIIKYTGPDPYIDGIILRSTDNFKQIRVKHNRRKHAQSGYTFRKLVSLWGNMFVNFSILPLRAVVILGFFITAISLFCGTLLIITKLLYPEIEPGWTSIITVILFLGGVQLTSIGVVGEYIGRSFLFLNKEPQFAIREILASSKKRIMK